MTPTYIGGVLLVIVGLLGVATAAYSENPNLIVATLSGFAVSGGLIWMGIIGARHGYHRRPPGAPPGDMDPAKATDPLK